MIWTFSSLGARLRIAMAGNWSDEQNDAIVANYFAMPADDSAGQLYNKTGHNRLLQALINRPRSPIEYKHQNISTVPRQRSLPGRKGERLGQSHTRSYD